MKPESTRHRLMDLLALALLTLVGACACGGGGGAGTTAASGAPPMDPPPLVDTAPVAVGDTRSALPADWQRGAFMEIYVRGYQDSDGDGVGDLKGLIQRLDYLKDLGITGIWLMPVTHSQDHNHGYAVSDYRAIEPQYGTLADFDRLLAEAHARGIGVIIDYVINHSGSQHPAFINSSAATNNPYRDWYLWQGTRPGGWSIYGSDPWRGAATGFYFAAFSPEMPDFNLLNPVAVAWHHDNLRFWLNRGVDGFRFDAVGHLVENGPTAWDNQPQNYSIMGAVRNLTSIYARRYLVCEAPGDPAGFAADTACGAAFAFGQQVTTLRAAKGDATALTELGNYFLSRPASVATFLSNHDSFAGARVWDQVNGNLAQYKLAAAAYLLQPGTPFLYYGEEIGMAGGGGLSGDTALRTPMSWTNDPVRGGFTTGTPFRTLSANVATQNAAAQMADPDSLRSHYRALLALRKARPSLTRGAYDQVLVQGSVLAFRRLINDEETRVVLNFGESPATIALNGLAPNAAYRVLLPAGAETPSVSADVGGTLRLSLPAQSVRVLGR